MDAALDDAGLSSFWMRRQHGVSTARPSLPMPATDRVSLQDAQDLDVHLVEHAEAAQNGAVSVLPPLEHFSACRCDRCV
jgi:hypothetical protein